MTLRLAIVNKAYSSWSLRPWMTMTHFGIPFDEIVIPMGRPETRADILKVSPTGKCPALTDGDVVVWESLAIIEYLAEKFPDLAIWPRDRAARAMARSLSNEMHGGFLPLREHLPTQFLRPAAQRALTPAVEADVARIETAFAEARARFGAGGPFLFGAFSAADAMFAPVVNRFHVYKVKVTPQTRAYMDAIMATPAWRAWISGAEGSLGESKATTGSGHRTLPRAREFLYGERSIIAEGVKTQPWSDLYHTALTASWPQFIGVLAALFVAVNVLFAGLFMLGGASVTNAAPGKFSDFFFFSVETISTTGYGDMHPQTLYGHIVAAAEIFVSLVATAGVTGLIFARFSRPRARLIFARQPVIQRHDGVDTLMVRVVNARHSFITEATAKMWLLGPSLSQEGRRYVGFRPMRLLRGENPAFALSWTLFHPIDDQSPLHGMGADAAIAEEVSVVVSILGIDETSSQTVHSRHVYAAEKLLWGHDFVDMFRRDEQGRSHIDVSKLHETQLSVK